jgi:protein O-mannosyl-transferase
MLVTLPCVLLLLDLWPLRRWQPKGNGNGPASTPQAPSRFPPSSLGWLVAEKVPLLAMSAGVCVIIREIQRAMGAMTMIKPIPLGDRIANAAASAVAYLWMMIWPVNLAVFYPHLSTLDAATRLMWQGIAAGALLAAITLLALWNLRRRPYLAVGWFWYLGALVPVIGLIQVGAQSMADRYTYLPMIGISIMVTWGAAELAAKSSRLRTPIAVAAGVLLAAWTLLSVHQVGYWKNSFTLFAHAVEAVDNNYFAHCHLGLAYQNAADNEIDSNRANEDRRRAEQEYAKAVEIAPSYDAANTNLGASYANRGEYEKALPYFQTAVRVNPFNSGPRCSLGWSYGRLGRYDEAEVVLREAVELDPNSLNGHDMLAHVLYSQGKSSEALAEWRVVLDELPDHVHMLNRVAWILATNPDASVRNGAEAVERAERAAKLTKGQVPEVLNTLAAAYAETGQFPLAVETQSKATKLVLRQNNPELAKLFRARLLLYEDGKPCREAPPAPKKRPPASRR